MDTTSKLPPHPTHPVCAIVLVNWFGAEDIAQAARAAQLDAPQARIIVVDNSANAAEHQRLHALLGQHAPGTQLLDAGANLGFGRACNLAFASTAAPFVFFVNPDVRLQRGCTAALVQALQADAGLAAVAPRQFLDSRCQWYMPPAWLPTAVRAWVHEHALRDARAWQRLGRAVRAENLRLWTAHAPVPQRALSGGALMLRRSALAPGEEPFDARFFMYYEDSDLSLRLRRSGQRLAVVPAARAIHAWRNLPHKDGLMRAGGQVYFDKHWPAGAAGTPDPWLARASALAATTPDFDPPFTVHAGARIDIPPAWQGGWLLELSPSPLLQPCIGLIAAGAQALVPREVLQAFGPAQVHGRLSALETGPGGAAVRLGAAQPLLLRQVPAQEQAQVPG